MSSPGHRMVMMGNNEFKVTQEMLLKLYNSTDESPFLNDYRLRALEAYHSLPMPTLSDEAWRRTDIKGLKASNFRLPEKDEYQRLSTPPQDLLDSLVNGQLGGQIALYPGGHTTFVPIDKEMSLNGVVFSTFIDASAQDQELLSHLIGRIVNYDDGKFAALAATMPESGVLFYVPAGIKLEQPFHTILWGAGTDLALFSHIIIWLEKGASATYIHEMASKEDPKSRTLHSGIIEIFVGEEADLKFVDLQSWNKQTWNFSHERARVEKNGNFDWIHGAVGSKLTKSFLDIDLVGNGASARMSGFYFTDGRQHLDLDTQQNHLSPDTSSDLLYKGALKDKSRSIWQGMIYVAPGAQNTDGYQANRNITLSSNARADSIPGLEILADDVRCTHGATVGKIDQDQLFYLQSRGIHRSNAEQLIIEGFFDPIMQRIPYEGVRERFQRVIHEKMV